MKKTLIALTAVLLLACSSEQKGKLAAADSTLNTLDTILIDQAESKQNSTLAYLASTYDNPADQEQLKAHRTTLKKLSEANSFATIQAKLLPQLSDAQQAYFKAHNDYELLATAKGNLFQESKNDQAFIVYDKKKERIAIVVYNDQTQKYAELYRDIKVASGLDEASCNYGNYGTLDYILGNEIIDQEQYLLNHPEGYVEASPCKITNLATDEDFAIDHGCTSKRIIHKDLSKALCIATSSVYNNWECLQYNKDTDSFLIVYGQAFAD